MWLAGYAARTKPSEGVDQELFAKALAIEDTRGTRIVYLTTDLIAIPRTLREAVESAVGDKYKLPPASLLMNASHTHCGPELREGRANLAGLTPDQVALVTEYTRGLEQSLLSVVGDALAKLEPVRLNYTHGRAGFAMNRRTFREGQVVNHPNPDGPVDHDVPVLHVNALDGSLRAILFGYACHNTTLGYYKFQGDYAGYAQEALEKAHPGVVALFLMGCGGDQNPYPRGTVELAQQHGRALANGVEAGLQADSRPINGPLAVALEHVPLEFAAIPTKDDLLKLQQSTDGYDRRRATYLLEELQANGKIHGEYPFPVQVVRFGNSLTQVALGGETVVDYSLRLKRELNGAPVWVAGYSNDVFAYVPSERVLKEGGYEGVEAMRYSALPGPFAPSVEKQILDKVHELSKRTRDDIAERAAR